MQAKTFPDYSRSEFVSPEACVTNFRLFEDEALALGKVWHQWHMCFLDHSSYND